jgi:eukaryotic-like serine/threonine-protein kinase
VEKESLLRTLWPDTFVEEANLSVQMAALRKALGDEGRSLIETVAKRGYRWVGPVEPGADGHSTPPGRVAPVRLVLLPLEAAGPLQGLDFLTFSLPDAMAVSLSDCAWLSVRSLRGGRARSAGMDLASLMQSNSVDAVLEGWVGEVDGEMVVRLRLLEVPGGRILYSTAFPATASDLFDRHTRAATEIAAALAARARMGITAPPSLASGPRNPGAYVSYLRANQLAYETTQWPQARALYEACLQQDPGFAPAWARLARMLRVIGKFGAAAAEQEHAFTEAEAAFERALALEPSLPLTHSLYAQLEVDLGRAETAMVRLLDLAIRTPNAAELYAGLVHALRFCGLLDASVASHMRARQLDGSIPTSVHHTWWMKGDYEKALTETFGDIGYMPGLALASLGSTREAIAALRWRERETTQPSVSVYLASLRALLEGNREECLRALDQAAAHVFDPEAHFYLARTYVRLGETRQGFAQLTRVVEGGFSCPQILERDPWLESIRRETEFQALHDRAHSRSLQAKAAYERAGGPALLGG